MKEDELRAHATCSVCKKPVGHTGVPLLWTARIKRHGVQMKEVFRQDALAAFMGSPAIARVMGTDQELTVTLTDEYLVICEACSLPLQALIEEAGK